MRGHRQQQQRAGFHEPGLRLQTRRVLPEEEEPRLREPAQAAQLQLPEVRHRFIIQELRFLFCKLTPMSNVLLVL